MRCRVRIAMLSTVTKSSKSCAAGAPMNDLLVAGRTTLTAAAARSYFHPILGARDIAEMKDRNDRLNAYRHGLPPIRSIKRSRVRP